MATTLNYLLTSAKRWHLSSFPTQLRRTGHSCAKLGGKLPEGLTHPAEFASGSVGWSCLRSAAMVCIWNAQKPLPRQYWKQSEPDTRGVAQAGSKCRHAIACAKIDHPSTRRRRVTCSLFIYSKPIVAGSVLALVQKCTSLRASCPETLFTSCLQP